MEDCDVITEIPFVIKVLLSFFLPEGQKVNYIISSECQKFDASARKSAVFTF